MKVAKEFRWEMGHRLKFHEGKCKNLHGHSYKMWIEFSGKEDENGMVIDYFDIKEIIQPLVDKLDHSFLVYKNDIELVDMLQKLNSNFTIVEYESTAENLCKYFLQKISKSKLHQNINRLRIKIFETENTYAEEELKLS